MNIGIEMECTEDMAIHDSWWMTFIMSSCNILSVNKLFLWVSSTTPNSGPLWSCHAMHTHFGHELRHLHMAWASGKLRSINLLTSPQYIKTYILQSAIDWRNKPQCRDKNSRLIHTLFLAMLGHLCTRLHVRINTLWMLCMHNHMHWCT